jgi:hypothetical protein
VVLLTYDTIEEACLPPRIICSRRPIWIFYACSPKYHPLIFYIVKGKYHEIFLQKIFFLILSASVRDCYIFKLDFFSIIRLDIWVFRFLADVNYNNEECINQSGARVLSHAVRRRLFIVLMTAAHISLNVFSLQYFLSNIHVLLLMIHSTSFILIVHHIQASIYIFYLHNIFTLSFLRIHMAGCVQYNNSYLK